MSTTNPLDEPAAKAPPGQTNNLVDPHSEAYLMIITATICLVASTLMVWIRLFVSACVIKRFNWDDGLIILSWLMFIAYSIIGLELLRHGALVDEWNITVGNAMQLFHLGWIEEMVYAFLIFFVKLLVLVLYKRIFVPARGRRTWVYYAIIAVIVFNAMFYTADLFIEAFNCVPTKKIWNPEIPGHCIDVYVIIIVTAVLNVVSDAFILAIPISVISQLHMPAKRKLEILFVFVFSTLCLLASIFRLIFSVLAAKDPNQSVALVKIDLWTFGEIASCFVTACVPMVPRLIHHFKDHHDSSKRGSSLFRWHRNSKQSSDFDKASNRTSDFGSTHKQPIRREDEEDPYFVASVATASADTLVNNESPTLGPTNQQGITHTRSVDVSSVPDTAHASMEEF